MVSVYVDICNCPMPPAREILSDALALWIQLHTHWFLSVCSWYLLSCTSTCTFYWFVFDLAPIRTLVMCDLWWSLSLLISALALCPLPVKSWVTHLPFGSSCIQSTYTLLVMMVCLYFNFVLLFYFVPFWIQMETHWPLWWFLCLSCLMTRVREILSDAFALWAQLQSYWSAVDCCLCALLYLYLYFILMMVLMCLIYAPVWCPVSVRSEESAQETKYLHRLSKVHLTRIAKNDFFWILEKNIWRKKCYHHRQVI